MWKINVFSMMYFSSQQLIWSKFNFDFLYVDIYIKIL